MFRVPLLALCFVLVGCADIRVTDPPRTATEQFLLSQAAERAVNELDFVGLEARRVFVDTAYFAASEQAFVLGELRARLLLAGARLVPERAASEIVMEVRSGGVGIDREDFLLGVPSLVLSADASNAFGVPFVTPELAVVKNIEQWGIASVAYVAYWTDTGEVVGASGPAFGWSTRDDWWLFGVGPESGGDIPPLEIEADGQ